MQSPLPVLNGAVLIRARLNIPIFTQSMQQAARVSDDIACSYLGELIAPESPYKIFVDAGMKESKGLDDRPIGLDLAGRSPQAQKFARLASPQIDRCMGTAVLFGSFES